MTRLPLIGNIGRKPTVGVKKNQYPGQEQLWRTEATDQSQTHLVNAGAATATLKAPNLLARIVDTNAETWTSGQVENGRSQVERTSLTAYDGMRLRRATPLSKTHLAPQPRGKSGSDLNI